MTDYPTEPSPRDASTSRRRIKKRMLHDHHRKVCVFPSIWKSVSLPHVRLAYIIIHVWIIIIIIISILLYLHTLHDDHLFI